MKKVLNLFWAFFKIGAFTFGGGYAMIPLIQGEIAEKKKWITDEEILDIIAIAESTPGPIAINSATFVGYRVGGVLGAFCATLGVVVPSFVIILVVSYFLTQFKENKYVSYAFFGIRAGVLALIIKALLSMYKKAPKGVVPYIIMIASFVLAAFTNINVIIVIIICAVVGLTTYNLKGREKQ